MVETETYTIEGPGGDTEALELPAGLVNVFVGRGEDPADVVADMIVQAFAQRTYAAAHCSKGGTPADIAKINEQMEELFKDRFGVPLSDALDHSH